MLSHLEIFQHIHTVYITHPLALGGGHFSHQVLCGGILVFLFRYPLHYLVMAPKHQCGKQEGTKA